MRDYIFFCLFKKFSYYFSKILFFIIFKMLFLTRISKLLLLLGFILVSSIILSVHTISASSDITSSSFVVPVDTFSPLGDWLIEWGATWNVNSLLERVLNALIVIFWVAAVFFMTLGAWYMIIYHGQDELLSKWKTIFTSGLIALVVALSAWLIVRLFIYLLYTS